MRYSIILLFIFIVHLTPLSFAQQGVSASSVTIKKDKPITPKPGKKFFGFASYYADVFKGRKTASGEEYKHKKLTAACNVLPIGTWVRVTNVRNQRKVVVQINDRMHPKSKHIIDLSYSAAEKLGYINAGIAQVEVLVLDVLKTSE
ncbi:MAG: septal ring lytic transglycosylase RlpA family protein [Flavisolibacter sp.]|nr:septal ring lytic transglycosylase RlpA family protein [Flavisolibacter sp.]MBD0284980.1 septal ring lytic transglycosylase RlpA family protein [Flavisolibacter sp.]MBD0298069.1 septal ring lytic transglycosylase RlpA family protein [Flavisolibacter sp.]MBD0350824.1 septal ring lytic transglycosylase RlpA family protein [Flavisolibacter sp.]MBD0366767.1 septal ring lytic transglycosylase RlpA family protein [Flavisolibacter sp.]